jgi:hypothetical protein
MSSTRFGLIELLLVFGVVLVWAGWQWWDWQKWRRQRRRDADREADRKV